MTSLRDATANCGASTLTDCCVVFQLGNGIPWEFWGGLFTNRALSEKFVFGIVANDFMGRHAALTLCSGKYAQIGVLV